MGRVTLNYIQHNKQYQRRLDQVYKGYLVPIDRFVNYDKATIKHHCLNCGESFFARPNLLIEVETQKHVCFMPYGDANGRRVHNPNIKVDESKPPKIRTWNNKISDESIQAIYALADKGFSQSRIADRLDISRPTIVKYLKLRGSETK